MFRSARYLILLIFISGQQTGFVSAADQEKPEVLTSQILNIMKSHCGKCHGPIRPKSGLMLMNLGGIARGSDEGKIVVPHQIEKSSLWLRIRDDEMPPEEPLSQDDKKRIRRWIETGAPGLENASQKKKGHWAFQTLRPVEPPENSHANEKTSPIDQFLLTPLIKQGLSFNPETDRHSLIRRVSFDITGLPPAPSEIKQFLNDTNPNAYEMMVDRYLSSPRYGERWGKYWLDTAGYADSNGYFNADTDRPLAYRYRDYVIRSFNKDKPFDQFIQEQLAGDEIANLKPNDPFTPQTVELLEATHFLRNASDGTDKSDGNPEERRIDKYKALEGTIQIISSSLLGLKLKCARCHEHKFEPIEHQEYYQFQAIFYPAFNIDQWKYPKDRFIYASSAAEQSAWKQEQARLDSLAEKQNQAYRNWLKAHPPRKKVLFEETFDSGSPPRLVNHWSNRAPDDDQPGGNPAVNLDSAQAPGALIHKGHLQLIETGGKGDRLLSTQQSYDWTPDKQGDWIQASFDLISDRVGNSPPSARIGYLIAVTDFNDRQTNVIGNILIDGHPSGNTAVHVDYPGTESQSVGTIGPTGYQPGHRYGIRITNAGDGKYELQHLTDGILEGKPLILNKKQLPEGGFGFEYCCGRSFIVDNVIVATNDPAEDPALRKSRQEQHKARQNELATTLKNINDQRTEKPGKIAWVTDLSPTSPDVYLLGRGEYNARVKKVQPAGLEILSESNNQFNIAAARQNLHSSTGSRLAFARWMTKPNSKAASLFARVTVNRIWQNHFGTGIVSTSDNLGYSGSAPTHPELLDWLANQFIQNRWSVKHIHRIILNSKAYRQSSLEHEAGRKKDLENQLLWHFPLRRLDAEAIRDAMLALSGELDFKMGGPYIPTSKTADLSVIVNEKNSGANRRSIYLQQKRTQVLNFLEVFDTPSIVFNCTQRTSTTVPTQSLSLLNSEFARNRATQLNARLQHQVGDDTDAKIAIAILLVFGRNADSAELDFAKTFLAQQPANYPGSKNAVQLAWIDFCQMLMASNSFLYVK
ncbi:PSD1 and planctomycete cytochrome C domain-containing protein [uncultured Gimesia sp.]|uniref:PSD1 and planctomycete cytochrome C domain-containing protein n=1 Tax=uncultured Gimesia sp. TaxID=1678688 RepID=UPI002636EE41|nr:PSD1 and planctomycete cytochrome C domain-containing protein [uncultured Gimesia sp.]